MGISTHPAVWFAKGHGFSHAAIGAPTDALRAPFAVRQTAGGEGRYYQGQELRIGTTEVVPFRRGLLPDNLIPGKLAS